MICKLNFIKAVTSKQKKTSNSNKKLSWLVLNHIMLYVNIYIMAIGTPLQKIHSVD